MNESKRLLKNTGIIAIGNISTKIVTFLLLPLYTSLLTTEEYGTFDYILTIVTLCVPFVSLLMNESIFRFLIDCQNEREMERVISASTFICLVGMILFTCISIPIMTCLNYQYTFYVVVYVLLSALIGMMGAVLRGNGRTDSYVLFNVGISIFQIAFNVLFIAGFHLGVYGLLLSSILAQLIVIVFFCIREKIWIWIHISALDREIVKELVIYSIPLIPNTISWTIINLSDRIIIMNVLGSSAAGVYALAYKFPNLLDTIYGFFYQSWRESAARVVKDGNQTTFYNLIYGYIKNFMFAIVIGMIAFMPIIFKLIIKNSFNEALIYVPILLLSTYFSNIAGFYGGIFTAYKDSNVMGITTMVAAGINLILDLCLIFSVGIFAAVFSTLAASFSVYALRKRKVKKYVVLEENVGKSLLAVVVLVLVLTLFYSQTIGGCVAAMFISVIYAVVSNKNLIMKVLKLGTR